MMYVETTVVKACIALLVVEGVLGVHHASLKYMRGDDVDMTCGVGEYNKKCCPEGEDNAILDPACACRCVDADKVTEADDRARAVDDSFCPAGHGPSKLGQFTTVSSKAEGDSVADGTGSLAHINRPHGFFLYTLWIVIALNLILASLYAHQQ